MQEVDRNDHDEEKSRDFRINPGTNMGYINLNVSDIQKSLEFYESTLVRYENNLPIEYCSQVIVWSNILQ
jgi:catechol-2,3-dioxygenase